MGKRAEVRGALRALEGLSSEDNALIDRLMGQVLRYRMGVPAIFLLESFSPMAVVGSQAMHFLSPIVGTFGVTGDYDRVARLLERRDVLEALICRIEAHIEGDDGAAPPKVEAEGRG